MVCLVWCTEWLRSSDRRRPSLGCDGPDTTLRGHSLATQAATQRMRLRCVCQSRVNSADSQRGSARSPLSSWKRHQSVCKISLCSESLGRFYQRAPVVIYVEMQPVRERPTPNDRFDQFSAKMTSLRDHRVNFHRHP